MARTNTQCNMRGCTREIQNAKRGLCNRCAAFQRFWARKPIGQMRDRFATIKFWSKRIEGEINDR